MTQKLIDILPNEGEHPLIKLPEKVVEFIRDKPQPPSYNAYICRRRSNHIFITVDIHSGVTPMFMKCRAVGDHCSSEAISAGYPNDGRGPVPEHLHGKPLFIWYRPSEPEFRKEPPEVRGHVMQGGLIIRPADRTLAQFIKEWEKHATT